MSAFASLVDDRAGEGVFRVDRAVYTDPEVFAAEIETIFEGNWIYLAHESQIASPGDYLAVWMGRQPVIVNRRADGSVGAMLNACAHRGARLTPTRQGKATTFVCRYHGWCYDTFGACTKIKDERTSALPPGASRADFALKTVPLLESYKGFIFGSLNADAPPLAEHLGEALPVIDLLADQSPEGMEVVPGQASYVVDGNWKLQTENGVDGYHVSTVHRNFVTTIQRRDLSSGATGAKRTDNTRFMGKTRNGCYDLGNGHNLIWTERGMPESAPLWEARDRLLPLVGERKWNWMCARGRNLLLFPNVFLMDQSSTQIRVIRPISASRTEVTVHCIAPKGESRAARTARLSKFRDFFLMSGLATPDDSAALEDTQAGCDGRLDRWNDLSRGIAAMLDGGDDAASDLGIRPVSTSPRWDHETLYHGQYRQWRRLMARADRTAA